MRDGLHHIATAASHEAPLGALTAGSRSPPRTSPSPCGPVRHGETMLERCGACPPQQGHSAVMTTSAAARPRAL